MKNLKKLIEKYNKILSKRYGIDYKILESEDLRGNLDALDSLQYDCISDSCQTWKECELIRKYLYFKYIEKDIEKFKKIEL